MISSGELYDWAAEVRDVKTKPGRLREMCTELLDNTHRLCGLIEEMADFRTTRQHDRMMAELEAISQKMKEPGKGGG